MKPAPLPWPRALPRALRRRPGVLLSDAVLEVGDIAEFDDAAGCRLRRVGNLAGLGIAASTAELETLWVLPQAVLAQLAPLLPPGAMPLARRRAGANEAAVVLPLHGGDLGVIEQALQRHLEGGGPWSRSWLLVTSVVPAGAAGPGTLCFAHRLRRAPAPPPLRSTRWRLLPFGRQAPALPMAPRRRGAAAQPPSATGPSLRSRSK